MFTWKDNLLFSFFNTMLSPMVNNVFTSKFVKTLLYILKSSILPTYHPSVEKPDRPIHLLVHVAFGSILGYVPVNVPVAPVPLNICGTLSIHMDHVPDDDILQTTWCQLLST